MKDESKYGPGLVAFGWIEYWATTEKHANTMLEFLRNWYTLRQEERDDARRGAVERAKHMLSLDVDRNGYIHISKAKEVLDRVAEHPPLDEKDLQEFLKEGFTYGEPKL